MANAFDELYRRTLETPEEPPKAGNLFDEIYNQLQATVKPLDLETVPVPLGEAGDVELSPEAGEIFMLPRSGFGAAIKAARTRSLDPIKEFLGSITKAPSPSGEAPFVHFSPAEELETAAGIEGPSAAGLEGIPDLEASEASRRFVMDIGLDPLVWGPTVAHKLSRFFRRPLSIRAASKTQLGEVVPLAERPYGGLGWGQRAYDSQGRAYEFRADLIEVDDLITSHGDALQPNPHFPKELQPRERTRVASQAQIEEIRRQLKPELLTADTLSLDTGSPIVGPDLVVESGNARTIALRKAYKESPEVASRYKAHLVEQSGRFGLDPRRVQEMKKPVLVRQRVTPVDRPEFVRIANEPSVARFAASETARLDASKISVDEIANLTPTEGSSAEMILSPRNREFVRSFMGRLPAAEQAELLDAAGRLSTRGVQRIQGAIFERVYGSQLTAMLAESTDANVKNLLDGMLNSSGRMARAKGFIEAGARDASLDITDDLVKAVSAISEARRQGVKVKDVLRQTGLFGEDLTPFQKAFVQELEKRSRSRNAVRELLENYAEMVESAPHPDQAALFKTPQPRKEQLFMKAARLKTAPELFAPETPFEPEDIFPEPVKKAIEERPAQALRDVQDDVNALVGTSELPGDATELTAAVAPPEFRNFRGELRELLIKAKNESVPEATESLYSTLKNWMTTKLLGGLGTKKENFQAILGPKLGEMVYNRVKIAGFEGEFAQRMIAADVAWRSRGLSPLARKAADDAVQMVRGVDEAGLPIFGARHRAGHLKTDLPEGATLPDGRVVGELMDDPTGLRYVRLPSEEVSAQGEFFALTSEPPPTAKELSDFLKATLKLGAVESASERQAITRTIRALERGDLTVEMLAQAQESGLPLTPTGQAKKVNRQLYYEVAPNEAEQIWNERLQSFPEIEPFVMDFISKHPEEPLKVPITGRELPSFSRELMGKELLGEDFELLQGWRHSFKEDPKGFFRWFRHVRNYLKKVEAPTVQYRTGTLKAGAFEGRLEMEGSITAREFLEGSREVRDLPKAVEKGRVETALAQIRNEMGEDLELIITEALAPGAKPKEGFIEYVGKFGDLQGKRLQIGEWTAKNIVALYGTPSRVRTGRPALDALASALDEMAGDLVDMAVMNMLLRPGTWTVNVVGQQLQNLAFTTENFWMGTWSKLFGVQSERGFLEIAEGVKAVPRTLPFVHRRTVGARLPEELTGGTFVGSLVKQKKGPLVNRVMRSILKKTMHEGDVFSKMWILETSLQAEARRELQRAIAAGKSFTEAEAQSFVNNFVKNPSPEALFKAMDVTDTFGFMYDNIPPLLEKLRRSNVGRGISPFPIYSYKFARLGLRLTNPENLFKLFGKAATKAERVESLAKLSTGATLFGGAYLALKDKTGKGVTPEGKKLPWHVDTSGRAEVTAIMRGYNRMMERLGAEDLTLKMMPKERTFARVAKYPFAREVVFLKGLLSGDLTVADLSREYVSTGPLYELATAVTGHRDEFDKHLPTGALVAKELTGLVPFQPWLQHLRRIVDPAKRKGHDPDASTLTSIWMTVADEFPVLSWFLAPRYNPQTGEVSEWSPTVESFKFFFGWNLKMVDTREIELALINSKMAKFFEKEPSLQVQELRKRHKKEIRRVELSLADNPQFKALHPILQKKLFDFARANVDKDREKLLSILNSVDVFMKENPEQRERLNELLDNYLSGTPAEGRDLREFEPITLK